MLQFINAKEELPSNSRHVAVLFVNEAGKVKWARATYYRLNECELSNDLDFFEGCTHDENKTPCVPAGWYENNEKEEINWYIGGVTHWADIEIPKELTK